MSTETTRILSNIKYYMEKNQEKTETFANKVGLSTGELSKILRGERKNFIKNLDKFSIALGVSVEDLLKLRNEESSRTREREREKERERTNIFLSKNN